MKAAAALPVPRPADAIRTGGTTMIVETPLRAPVSSELSDRVQWLLRRGERCIVLDLSGLPSIDAAGAGELIRLLNVVRTAGGTLEITCDRPRLLVFLERAGVLPLLTSDRWR